MIRKELAQLEDHIQELNRMSGVLFELWGDKVSHIFGEKCIGVIKNDWKNYSHQMIEFSNHLKEQMKEMENIEHSMKRVQDGYA